MASPIHSGGSNLNEVRGIKRSQASRKGGGRWKDAGRQGASGIWPVCSRSRRTSRTGMGIRPMNKNGSRAKQASPTGGSMTKDRMSARAATAVQIRQCR